MNLRGGAVLLAVLAGGPWLTPRSAGAVTGEDLQAEIVQLADSESWDEVAASLAAYFESGGESIWAHHRYGQALFELERLDEAAFHLDRAMGMMVSAGEDAGKEFRVVRGLLKRADPLSSKRTAFFAKLKRYFKEGAVDLLEDGHDDLALDLLERCAWLLSPKEDAELITTLEQLRVADEEVDLDAEGEGRGADADRPLIQLESAHYRLACNLEPEVTQAVADTMDDIFQAYVQIYLDGKEDLIPLDKAELRIFGSWETMTATYPGQAYTPGLGGWWSPSENKVTNYDTRDRTGSLDEMLGTLFHEASHQFMTALSKRGGWSPAWLNEGTACFFEGAKAMQDSRVLWPDAATNRLRSLSYMLPLQGQGNIPTVADVIGFNRPGSYPGEYYAFGWGLVYYFQQYEDPDTLAYVWRPYYQDYLQRVTSEGGNPRELFDEVFLADGNPGDFASFEDFADAWQDWILEDVRPMHTGNQPRNLRLQRVEMYLEAAEKAKTFKRGGVSEAELLGRALRDLVHVRTAIDRIDTPDGEVAMQEALVLRRLGRDGAEAWSIQQVMDLSDEGYWDGLTDEAYAELADRLGEINEDYRSMGKARNRQRALRRDFRSLLQEYLEQPGYPLRAYTLAAVAGDALKDPHLRTEADRLRREASASGTLAGTIQPLDGDEWFTTWSGKADTFEHAEARLEVAKDFGPFGFVCRDLELSGEYELRGRLVREGDVGSIGSFHGVVVSGMEDGSWIIVGIDNKGQVGAYEALWDNGSTTLTSLDDHVYDELEEPLADDQDPMLTIRVLPEGELTVTVDDQPPVEISLPTEMPRRSHPGIFAKSGRTILESFVIENYP